MTASPKPGLAANPGSSASGELTTVEKLSSLPWVVASNAANTIFVQFTFFGTVFVLFLDELGFSKSDIGFVLSFTPFAGLIALFVAPWVAQFGYKRTFVTFWTIRKFITALLLLTPWVVMSSPQLAFLFVAGITALFSLSRAVAETGRFPWMQEIVPNSVQGKFTATNNIFATLLGIVAVAIAGTVLGRTSGLTGYMILLAVGVAVGLLSAWLMARAGGGKALSTVDAERKQQRDLTTALADQDFRRYLIGAGLVVIATTPLNSFIPLFMQEVIGLATSAVVYLQTGTLLGAMLTSFLWGWAADRYGSKPIMLSGLVLKVLLAGLLVALPLLPFSRLPAALVIVAIGGVAEMGWAIGSVRLLFVGVVPPDKKSDYMALYFSVIGIIGGLSQLFSGRILDIFQQVLPIVPGDTATIVHPFLPLFLIGIICPAVALIILRRIYTDDALNMGQFLGIFFRGNPFLAMSSLIRYSFVRSEDAAIYHTERLGQARSLMTVDELLDALADPRFNVRFEAIVAISRMQPDSRLRDALLSILADGTPALSVVAAWALGRIGDPGAIEGLQNGLSAPFRSIQAHSARALGTLQDFSSLPVLRQRFHNQEGDPRQNDPGLRMAYASALGKMRDEASLDEMLKFLSETTDLAIQLELALALCRVVGNENYFIQIQRQTRQDQGTAFSHALTALHRLATKKVTQHPDDLREIEPDLLLTCAEKFAREELDEGVAILADFAQQLLENGIEDEELTPGRIILNACCNQFAVSRGQRREYLLLTFHTIHAELES
ncbi:MAG: MFS transporter [Chloroflexota bacterium]